ncbi:unnamed protein product [Blepharisma stoltei]|uniref:Uncharacterized protein n=1 Tax=Blepharisma stoltei TaxID=1481888 RepID=A0AAU9JQE0_9CILI|nr:unnamed protein product [Blepharisma stoltei]
MIRSISQVNNYFYLISNNEELWKFYYLKDFGNINSNETHYKNQYIALAAKCCFWLHKIADENNHLLSICPRCGISEINPQALKLKFNIWDRLSKKKYQNKLNPAIEKFNMKKRNLIRMIQKKFKDYSLANFAGKGKCEEFIDLDSVYSLLEIESSFSFREIEIRILIIGDTGLEIILFQSIFW